MRFAALTTTALIALALAGCKKPAPEARDAEVSNSLAQVPADIEVPSPPPVVISPVAPPVAANVARTQAPPPATRFVPDDEQIAEDADAAGMTSRLPEERDTQPAEQKAEDKEQK